MDTMPKQNCIVSMKWLVGWDIADLEYEQCYHTLRSGDNHVLQVVMLMLDNG
jgi:hypothetical protein